MLARDQRAPALRTDADRRRPDAARSRTESAPAGRRSATHSTWWVIGNRSKARSDGAGSRARRRCRGRGPARRGRRRRRRPPGAAGQRRASTTSRPAPVRGGSSTTRSLRAGSRGQPALDPAAAQPDPAGTSAGCCRAAATAAGWPPRRPRPRQPTRRPARRRTARPRSRGRGRAPPAGARSPASTAPTRVSAAAGWTCQKPSAATASHRRSPTRSPARPSGAGVALGPQHPAVAEQHGAVGRPARGDQLRARAATSSPVTAACAGARDRAAVRRHRLDVVRAVLAQPRPAVVVDRVAHPGPPAQPVSASPGATAPRPRPAQSIPASRCSCSATTAAFSRAGPPGRRAGSRSRRSRPGPATGQRGGTRSGDGLEDLDGVAAPEPVVTRRR